MSRNDHLLEEFARILNREGAKSEAAREFIERHSDDEELIEMARIAQRLKVALTTPRMRMAYSR